MILKLRCCRKHSAAAGADIHRKKDVTRNERALSTPVHSFVLLPLGGVEQPCFSGRAPPPERGGHARRPTGLRASRAGHRTGALPPQHSFSLSKEQHFREGTPTLQERKRGADLGAATVRRHRRSLTRLDLLNVRGRVALSTTDTSTRANSALCSRRASASASAASPPPESPGFRSTDRRR